MKHLVSTFLVAAALLAAAPAAQAGVGITGSVSTSDTNVAYQKASSQYASVSLDINLGRYVLVGYTYGLQSSSTKGWKDPTLDTATDPDYCKTECGNVYSNTQVIEHSVGLTLILYQGEVFTPFIMGGGIYKLMTVESQDYNSKGQLEHTKTTSPVPGPYAGAGLGIRLNRDFSLKFSYQISPGQQKKPGDEEAKSVWDKRTTVGITYQL